jgi:diguanylate cyclase (GGDEF)-like protein
MSIGVAQYPVHAQTLKGVIRAADQALYSAKNAGRDRIEAAA